MKQTVKNILLILIGALIFAVGINYFTIPNHLSEGGIIGLTFTAHYLFNWAAGIVSFVLNMVLFLIGYKFFEKRNDYIHSDNNSSLFRFSICIGEYKRNNYG
ncbi:MAG: YitT family protein [Heyndrickxia sp.]